MTKPTAPLLVPPEMLRRLAVAEHLCPVFQAIFDREMRVVAYEALMRVIDVDGKMVALDRYVAEFEAAGLISVADIHMTEQVFNVLQHIKLHAITLNVSLRTLETQLGAYVAAARRLREPCERVIVELTETAPFVDAGQLRASVAALREAGLLVALDDVKFGHPYGHIDLLLSVQPDYVKIDGPFFHEALKCPSKLQHLRSVISAAHSFGSQVIIEWVDSAATHERAFDLGADCVQGFYFGAPRSVWSYELCRLKNPDHCRFDHCPVKAHERPLTFSPLKIDHA